MSKQNIKLKIAPLLSRVLGQQRYQMKRNSSGNSIFLVWWAVFQPKLNKLRKTTEKWLFFNVLGQFWGFFEVCSILTEKQRTKAKNSNSVINFASLDMYVAPKLAIIVEWMKYFPFLLVCYSSLGFLRVP